MVMHNTLINESNEGDVIQGLDFELTNIKD